MSAAPDEPDWPDELSEPRKDQFCRGSFTDRLERSCLIGWARRDFFGGEPRLGTAERALAYDEFIAILYGCVMSVDKKAKSPRSIMEFNDDEKTTTAKLVKVYKAASAEAGYTEAA